MDGFPGPAGGQLKRVMAIKLELGRFRLMDSPAQPGVN